MRTLSAKRLVDGQWVFHCPLHAEPFGFTTAGITENNVIRLLRDHIDEQHPGVKVRLHINSGKFSTHAVYTGTETVETGDLL